MSDFQSAVTPARPDPFKRVNYAFGLVLGVDEFAQEQGWAVEKHRRLTRWLFGFGTLWGLKVEVRDGAGGPEVHVAPGVAITPGGREVCVPGAMCARLDDWLRASSAPLRRVFGAPPFTAALCVALCYRECLTDVVPIPGEPCRGDDETLAPSRVAETFELKLCVRTPPDAPADPSLCACPGPGAEAEGRRALAQLLRRVRVGGTRTLNLTTRAALEAEVRHLGEPPAQGRPSPPPDSPLPVRAEELRELLGAAARVWATEVLPRLLDRDGATGCAPADGRCVPLADLQVAVDAAGAVDGGAAGVQVDESRRPVLLAGAVLQEWALHGGAAGV